MTDIEKLYKLLENKTPVVCMLAPSFVACFKYPEIVWKLRAIGFDKVVELTFGAKMVNTTSYEYIKSDHTKTWISSPCPTLVQLIRNKYPHLKKNLIPVVSPMGAMSLICKKFFPKHKLVFIGPCLTKKIEARELGNIALALTFEELGQSLEEKKIIPAKKDKETFDKFYNDYTKIYPLAGAMGQTMHYKKLLKEDQVLALDGVERIVNVLDKFVNGKYKRYVFLDILSCKGGCIGGPGMIEKESLKKRHERVLKYRNYAMSNEKDLGRRGKIIHAEDIDFTRKF